MVINGKNWTVALNSNIEIHKSNNKITLVKIDYSFKF